jgi:hypothetical protein
MLILSFKLQEKKAVRLINGPVTLPPTRGLSVQLCLALRIEWILQQRIFILLKNKNLNPQFQVLTFITLLAVTSHPPSVTVRILH